MPKNRPYKALKPQSSAPSGGKKISPAPGGGKVKETSRSVDNSREVPTR